MKLFINEFAKDYKKKSTFIYLLVIFIMQIFVNFIATYEKTPSDYSAASELIASSFSVATSLSYIFILLMFANNLSQEYSKGTIKFLYSRPKSRTSVLTSKICLAIFNFIFFTMITFSFDVAMKKFVFYKNHINLHTVFNDKLGEENFNRVLWEHIGIQGLAIMGTVLFYISLVLLICVVFKTQILSLIIVMFMTVGSSIISALTTLANEKFSFVKYSFTNIQKLPDYYTSVQGRELVEEVFKLNSTSLLIMLLSYTVLFAIIAYIVNAKRDITLD